MTRVVIAVITITLPGMYIQVTSFLFLVDRRGTQIALVETGLWSLVPCDGSQIPPVQVRPSAHPFPCVFPLSCYILKHARRLAVVTMEGVALRVERRCLKERETKEYMCDAIPTRLPMSSVVNLELTLSQDSESYHHSVQLKILGITA